MIAAIIHWSVRNQFLVLLALVEVQSINLKDLSGSLML